MGSLCTIVLEADSESDAAKAATKAFERIAQIEQAISDYRPNSEVMLLMNKPKDTWHSVSWELYDILQISLDISTRTDSRFDPVVGAFTHLWRGPSRPTRAQLAEAAHRVGMHHIQLDDVSQSVRFDRAGIIIDFGGIGKGYAAQKALELLYEEGYSIASVDIGGDLAFGDSPTSQPQGWRVEIVTGLDESREIYLANCSIATSGDLERFFEYEGVRYSHILDPSTGIGIAERRAATVIAPDAALADALASAAIVGGREQLGSLRAQFPEAKISLITRPIDD